MTTNPKKFWKEMGVCWRKPEKTAPRHLLQKGREDVLREVEESLPDLKRELGRPPDIKDVVWNELLDAVLSIIRGKIGDN